MSLNRPKLLIGALSALALMTTASVALASTDTDVPDDAVEEVSSDGGVININTASVEQLTFLPGIGESKAERIVAFRTKTAFKSPAELARVKGIGLKSVRKLRPWLRVSGPTTLAGPVRAQDSSAAATPKKPRRAAR